MPFVEVWIDEPAGPTREQREAIEALLNEVASVMPLLLYAAARDLQQTALAVIEECDLDPFLVTSTADAKYRQWLLERDRQCPDPE
jgi:hypothetical protein